jgi:dTDP-4-amino-4,6-dideoxygalactose transaminase
MSVAENAVKRRIHLSSPHMSDQGYERAFVDEAFATNWVAPLGPNVDAFEKEFADTIGVKGALAVSSGTAAVHLALKAVGVQAGDLVFCQDLTFAATANPIRYQNATPVFIDSDHTWNMCPVALTKAFEKYEKLGQRPKAVIVVHLYGLSADLDPILELCRKYEVPLIEDAAESLGSRYKGKATGSFGDLATFSFNGNKIVTTSGGGMLVSDDPEKIKKARYWATQAREPVRHYEHKDLGYNYRMSNVAAGIGRGQLRVLDERLEKKRYIFDYYKEHLGGLEGLEMMPVQDYDEPNFWLSCIILTGRVGPKDVIDALEAENIESRPIWKPMHMQPYYRDCDFISARELRSVSEEIFANGVCLSSDTKLTDDDLVRIVKTIRRLWDW